VAQRESSVLGLPLPDHEIHLWLAHYQELDDLQLHATLRALLNDAERAQETRFHFADDRLRYLITRAMVRTVLSRYADVAAADWEFTLNAYGRPEIAQRHGVHGLHFNLSHTRGLIAMGVTRKRALGVDVENVAERQPSIGIANHFFSAAEVAALESLPEQCRGARFFEYWTFKESYIKARGMGLSLPLDRFSVHFHGEQAVSITADAEIDDDPQRWGFWQCRPTPQFLLAVCAESRGGPPPRLTVRQVVPTVGESDVEIVWLKTPAQALSWG
jgi:4'-phosphopantetheinyl transferase